MAQKTVSLSELNITGYDEDYILQTIEKSGKFYEQALLDEWTPLLGNPKVILDVGANLGNHTMYWATHLEPQKICSFEPFPANYNNLKKNIRDNNLSMVDAVAFAVGDRCGKVKLKSFDTDNYGATSFEYGSDENDIRVVTLDSVRKMLDIQEVSFVKIDTEGFEMGVLKGMKQIIKTDKPALWIEVSDETVCEVVKYLTEYDYQLAKMNGANLLFLPPKLKIDKDLSMLEVLKEDMYYLSRTNTYYKNYEKAKQWLASKQVQNEALQQKISSLEIEKRDNQQKISSLEIEKRDNQQKISSLEIEKRDNQQKIDEQDERITEIEKLLEKSYGELSEDAKLLEMLKRQLQQVNAKLQLANVKNKEYETKLNKVYGTWYGRIALKIYKVLKKVKGLLH